MDKHINFTMTATPENMISGVAKAENSLDALQQAVASNVKEINQNIIQFSDVSSKSVVKTVENVGEVFQQKTERAIFNVSAFIGALKKGFSFLSKMVGQLAEIERKANAIGASAEGFQKLKIVSDESGESLSDLETVFKHVNKTARKAAEGSEEAAAAIRRIGISINMLKGMNPQQTFDMVAKAAASMGNSAKDQQAKIAVFGEEICNVNDSLMQYLDLADSTDGIIGDDTVASAAAVSKSMEKIKGAAAGIADVLGVFKLLEAAADRLELTLEELKARANPPKPEYKTWNETQVSEENRRAAEEYDRKWLETENMRNLSMGYRPGIPFKPAVLPVNDEGLTPGQMKYHYDPVKNPSGFKSPTASAPATKEEIEAASAKTQKKREEDEKQKAVIAEQAAKDAEERRVKFEEALAEERKTPYQKKIEAINADYGKKMAEATEIYGSQEKIPENVMSQLNWQRQTQLSEATASFQKAQTRNQGMVMRPIYNARINNALRNVAGGGMDIRAMVEQQRRTNELLAKGNYIKVRN